jgi:hypothetical protein
MMKRKICMLLDNAFHSDERVRKEINTLIADGFEITLIATDDAKRSSTELIPGLPVLHWIKTDLTRPFSADYKRSMQALAERIAALPFDALYIHDMYLAALALAIAKLKPEVVLLYDMHEYFPELDYSKELPKWTSRLKGKWVHKNLLNKERELIQRSRLVTVTSAPIAAALSNRFSNLNVTVLPNIPDWENLEDSTKERINIRLSLSIPQDAPLLVHSGNIYMSDDRSKEMVKLILETHPRLHLLFINDRDQGDRLLTYAQKQTWRQRFHLCAFQVYDHLRLLQTADAGWMHIESHLKSRIMTSPNRLYEYFLAGLPVLSSPQDEARHLKNQGYHGIHFYALDDLQELNHLIGSMRQLETPTLKEREVIKWSNASQEWSSQIKKALSN